MCGLCWGALQTYWVVWRQQSTSKGLAPTTRRSCGATWCVCTTAVASTAAGCLSVALTPVCDAVLGTVVLRLPTQALGTAAALRCVCLLRYLAHNRSYYTLVLTLSRAVPRVLRFLVRAARLPLCLSTVPCLPTGSLGVLHRVQLGVLPIFFAYSLFAVVVFGDQVEQFGSLWGSMVTLFAVLNGDVIRDTFMSLEVDHFIVGQVFMYSFVSLFIFCCLNVTIALVEEAFFFTAERSAELERTRAALEASTQPPRHSDDGSARRGQAQPAGTATSQSSAGDGVRELPVATDSHAVELGLHATRQAGLADEFKHDGGEGSPADAPATARSTQLSAVARLLSAKDIDDHARIANRS